MSDLLSAALFSLFVWWFSTGAILWLDQRPPSTFPGSMLGATLALALALAGLERSAGDASPAGAYCAFASTVVIWGWQEMAFLMGFITGPRRTGCGAGCGGIAHFRHGVEAVLYHELALVACAAAVLWITWGGVNHVGAQAFLCLWGLRLSAKLNLFLGVPNSGSEMLPPHLRYLESFFSTRSINALFPVSITVSTAIAGLLWFNASAVQPGSFEATGSTLLATLVSLAVLEHWLMVLPIKSSALWVWYLNAHQAPAAAVREDAALCKASEPATPIGVGTTAPIPRFSTG